MPPLVSTGVFSFADGSFKDAPITEQRRRGAIKSASPPEGQLYGKPSEFSKHVARDVRLAKELGLYPYDTEPLPIELCTEFPVSSNKQRFGPNGSIYLLPTEGDTLDMIECDMCGRGGHLADDCAYNMSFPPDGFIARPDLYELICWCGSLNISPDPPHKCNRCQEGGNALMARSKQRRQSMLTPGEIFLKGEGLAKRSPCLIHTNHLAQFKDDPITMI